MKTVFYLLLIIVLINLIDFGILLGPHHLQIRAIDITLPELSAVRQLPGKANGPVGLELITTAEQDSDLGTLGHVAVLVSWRDGRQLLIDAGMNQ